jgi:hypothetical protein
MKKLLSLLCVFSLAVGCASHHIKATHPAPVAAVVPVSPELAAVVPVSPELAAVRGVVLPATPAAKVAASAPVVSQPASVVPQPVVAKSPGKSPGKSPAVAPAVAAKSPAKSPAKSHKLVELVGLMIALAVVAFLYGVKLYTWGAKLVKKVLAWVKAHNVVADLKALAAKADADAKAVVSKIEVDFQKDKSAVDPAKPVPVLPPSTTAHLAPTSPIKAPVTEASVLAAIHPTPASKA